MDYNESRAAKKVKKPQPPLDGMIGKWYFGRFAIIKDPLEEENDQTKVESIMEEDNNETLVEDEYGWHDIVD